MSKAQPTVARVLARLVQTSQENADSLTGSMQRSTRELAALSTNFRTHMARSGMHSIELEELDTSLAELTAIVRQTRIDLERRVCSDVQQLRALDQVTSGGASGKAQRASLERLGEHMRAYGESLEFEYFVLGELLTGLSFRLRVLANNIEIAASNAGAGTASASVELFCLMSNQLRGFADRLRTTTADLQLFQQSQKGQVEAVRQALRDLEQEAVA